MIALPTWNSREQFSVPISGLESVIEFGNSITLASQGQISEEDWATDIRAPICKNLRSTRVLGNTCQPEESTYQFPTSFQGWCFLNCRLPWAWTLCWKSGLVLKLARTQGTRLSRDLRLPLPSCCFPVQRAMPMSVVWRETGLMPHCDLWFGVKNKDRCKLGKNHRVEIFVQIKNHNLSFFFCCYLQPIPVHSKELRELDSSHQFCFSSAVMDLPAGWEGRLGGHFLDGEMVLIVK